MRIEQHTCFRECEKSGHEPYVRRELKVRFLDCKEIEQTEYYKVKIQDLTQ